MNMDGRFYAEEGAVFRQPQLIGRVGNSTRIQIGFQLCKVTDGVSENAGEVIAMALNRLVDAGEMDKPDDEVFAMSWARMVRLAANAKAAEILAQLEAVCPQFPLPDGVEWSKFTVEVAGCMIAEIRATTAVAA